MIVRDAAEFVVETLTCALPFIDTWSIVDTGSVDDTADVVQRFFSDHGVPGTLHRREWLGFAHNRTEALALASGSADYALVLDADDLIVGSLPIENLTADNHFVRFGPDNVFWRSAFFRLSRRWEYRGVVHEYAVCLDEGSVTARLEGDYHFVFRSLGNRGKDPEKFQRDIDALLVDWERDPDPRTAFYLGASYRDLGNDERALEWFTRRKAMPGWDEETFVAALEAARITERLHEDSESIVVAYTDAWEMRPHRAEALFELARFLLSQKRFPSAYKVISRAASYPFPADDILFVPAEVYRWQINEVRAIAAQALGFHEESVALSDELLASPFLPFDQRDRILAGRRFSIGLVAERRRAHRPNLVNAVVSHLSNPSPEPRLTLSITTCRRRDLFERTIDSFLQCCVDRLQIDRWICIDDGSSEADLETMRARYPFFEFIVKDPSERGHAHSMNRLLHEVTTPYWLHLEDDWDFVSIGHFVNQAIDVLESDPDIFQVVLNRHYAETLDQPLVGGEMRCTTGGFPFRAHVHLPLESEEFRSLLAENPGCLSAAYWPGFSLMPSLMRTEAVRSVGAFHPGATHFEMEFGVRARDRGWRTAFLDTVICITTGPLRGDRSASRAPNAYDLNGLDQFEHHEPVTVGVVSAYAPPTGFVQQWQRQFPADGAWRGVRLVEGTSADIDPDYWLVVNVPPDGISPPPERTIVVQMEPSDGVAQWGSWAAPDPSKYVQVRSHARFPNTLEWHLDATYDTLWSTSIVKSRDLSAVVSSKRLSPGHHQRLDLIHQLERAGVPVDIYGFDNAEGFLGYRGQLPPHDKRDGLFPYRYTITVENCTETNYFTEKIVDAVLSECLAFYGGCRELEHYIDADSFIRLPTDDPDASRRLIEAAIANHEWQRRLPAIRRAKRQILDHLQLAPLLARTIEGHRVFERCDVRVINLDRRPDRLATFRTRLLEATGPRLSARCERFAAIDGAELELTDHIAHTFRGSELPLRRAQTACAISHLALWWEVANGDGTPMLILEDDAELVPDFNSRFVEVCVDLARPATAIDIVMLGLLRWAGVPEPSAPNQRIAPLDLDGVMGGLFAYVLTQRGARRLWDIVQRDGIPTGIDTFLLAQTAEVRVGMAVPSLASAPVARPGEQRIDSDIQYDGALL